MLAFAAEAGAFAALGSQHAGVAGVGITPAQVVLQLAGQRGVDAAATPLAPADSAAGRLVGAQDAGRRGDQIGPFPLDHRPELRVEQLAHPRKIALPNEQAQLRPAVLLLTSIDRDRNIRLETPSLDLPDVVHRSVHGIDDLLHLGGKLGIARIAEIDRHLVRCAECTQEVRDLRDFVTSLPSAGRVQSRQAWAYIGAIVVAVAFVIGSFGSCANATLLF